MHPSLEFTVRSPKRRLGARLGSTGLAAFLCGCTLGPDFVPPSPPAATGYMRGPAPQQTVAVETPGGTAQRFHAGEDIPGQWWTLFHSEALNAIIARALKANPDLQSAQAALRMARENALAQRGIYYPAINADFSSSRQRVSDLMASPLRVDEHVFDLFTGQITVSYAPDVFGLNHRMVESAQAQAEAQKFQTEAAYLALTANLVVAAIQEANLREQIAATERIIAIEMEGLALVRRQRSLGQTSQADIAAQEAALAQVQATLPPLKKQLAQQRDLLTALLGRLPSEEPEETFTLAGLQLPEDLPVTLPSRLVQQRPDIRAAEANLHAASAQVGVAVASRFPNITLSGLLGGAGTTITNMFSSSNSNLLVGGDITAPIFRGNTLRHQERAARAAYDQAVAQYRSTVVSSFQNVADVLHAITSDAEALQSATHAEQVAAASLAIAQQRNRMGAVGTLALLNAQQAYQQALINLTQARASRYADTAALFQALGGGWWNRADLEPQREAATR